MVEKGSRKQEIEVCYWKLEVNLLVSGFKIKPLAFTVYSQIMFRNSK